MVYCGKPSKGCSICRKRKIRCDQGVPSCGQCIKSEKDCPGYRNMLDLSFRNESEDVIKKAKAKTRRSPDRPKEASHITKKSPRRANVPQTSALVSLELVPSTLPRTIDSSQASLTYSLEDPDWSNTTLKATQFELSTFSMRPTIEDNGISLFIYNFVRAPDGPSHGYFYYIDDLCRNGAFNDTLQAALIATGLASQATKTKSNVLMTRARKEYATALRRINNALRSPVNSLKDSTLLAIIIIAIFESIVGAKQLSLREWTEHVNGAATLVKLRGRAQLQNRGSRGLFLHATSHVKISCLQREVPMPEHFLKLRNEARLQFEDDPSFRFVRISDDVTEFRGAIKTGQLKDPAVIVAKALELDNSIPFAFSDVPYGWDYEIVYTDVDCVAVFEGCYHIYYDHWVAQMWNAMRSSRLMLHETIRAQLMKGFTSTPRSFTAQEFRAQFQASADICTQMREDIFRSVPQHVGFVSRKPFITPTTTTPSSPHTFPGILRSSSQSGTFNVPSSFTDYLLDNTLTSPPSLKENLTPDPTHPSIGGYFLLWPLYVAGITKVNKPEHRKFVATILHYIGEVIGVRAGTNLAAFMRENFMDGPAAEMLKLKMAAMGGNMPLSDVTAFDERRPLMEMLDREEKERVQRLRTGRAVGLDLLMDKQAA